MSAHHNCPSCGFLHPSEGAEVPAIVVNEAKAPSLPEVGQFIQETIGKFGLHMGSTVNQVMQALEGHRASQEAAGAPVTSKSVCPLCGPAFTSENADEFNAHMRAHQSGGVAVRPPAAPVAVAIAGMSPELARALNLA